MKRSYFSLLSLLCLLCTIVLSGNALAGSMAIIQLTTNEVYDGAPIINDIGHAVWPGRGGIDGGPDYEVFFWDGSAISPRRSPKTSSTDSEAAISGSSSWKGS